MRPNLVSCHLPVREYREENVDNIVDECPAILRKGYWSARVVGKNVWQQLSRHAHCVLPRIAARVFQLVREDANETIIIRWLPVEVRLPLLSGEENRLHWSSTPVCLDPAFSSFVQCASPKSHLITPQSRDGQFKHDAANIFVGEAVVPRNCILLKRPFASKKKGSLRQPTNKRQSPAFVTRASFPAETGASSTITSPSSHAPAAGAP